MERPKRKAIYFDLDTNEMKHLGVYPDGYRQLGKELEQYNFEHRQGSGYVSKEKITSEDISGIVEEITNRLEWFSNCVKEVDVMDIGKQYSLLGTVYATVVAMSKNSQQNIFPAELTANDEKVIERVRKSAKGKEYETLMQQSSDSGTIPSKLINTLHYFSSTTPNGKSDAQVTEQLERILTHSKAYDGNADSLHKQVTSFMDDYKAANKKTGTLNTRGKENCKDDCR